MQLNILTIILFICAYLIGSIVNAIWVGKLFYGIDVREHGSKNAGSTNTVRILGWKAGIPVFLLYVFKGGKGVASLFGIVLAIALWPTLITLGIFVITLFITRYVSLSSMIAG